MASTTRPAATPRAWGARSRGALRWVMRVATCGALAYGLLLAVSAAHDYATTAPRFAVHTLVSTPTPHLTNERLRSLMNIQPGTNILAIELEELRATIEDDPWIVSASVYRELPDTLHVSVVEHDAAAVLHAGGMLLIDGQGAPFKRLDRGERGELPIITGVDRAWLGPEASPVDRARVQALARRGLEIKRSYEVEPRPRLSEIHIGEGDEVTLYTAELGTPLRLGRGAVEPKLARYDALRAALGDKADALAVVHLDIGGGPEDKDRVVASFLTSADEREVLARASGTVADPSPSSSSHQSARKASAPAARERWSQGQARRIPRYE